MSSGIQIRDSVIIPLIDWYAIHAQNSFPPRSRHRFGLNENRFFAFSLPLTSWDFSDIPNLERSSANHSHSVPMSL